MTKALTTKDKKLLIITDETIVNNPTSLTMGQLDVTSVQELRILESALALYSEHGDPVIEFSYSDLLKLLGQSTGRFEGVDQVTDGLMRKFVQYRLASGNHADGFVKRSLIRESSYYKGVIRIVLDEQTMAVLKKHDYLSMRGAQPAYRLVDSGVFRSTNPMRFFGILAAHTVQGYYRDSIDNIRTILKIADGKYARYPHLKSRIIMPSIKAINEHGVIVVDPAIVEIKEGRKVVAIQINILEDNRELPAESLNLGNAAEGSEFVKKPLSALLRDNGINETSVPKLLNEIEARAHRQAISSRLYLQSNIDYVREVERQTGKPKTGGYLRNALLHDYAAQTRRVQPADDVPVMDVEILRAAQVNERVDRIEGRIVDEYLATLSAEQTGQLIKELREKTKLPNSDLTSMFFRHEIIDRIPNFSSIKEQYLDQDDAAE